MSGEPSSTIPASLEWTSPRFKTRLAEANNARLLDLSRADLVQAMDPEDVQLSEVSYLNATFPLHPDRTGKALIAMTPDPSTSSTPAAAPGPARQTDSPRRGVLLAGRLEGLFHAFAYSNDVWKADPFDVESIHADARELVRSHREPRAGASRASPPAGSSCCWANRAAARPT